MATTKSNSVLNSASNPHSTGWIIQVWASLVISIGGTLVGITYAPINAWVRGYLAMGVMFSVGSAISVTKTTRDIHEAQQFTSRIDAAKLERLLASHDPYKM
ncbi:MAG: hypothetical protein HC800_24845 [Phormidesmis sp. RL_2_1]|nr:hypothetical protein [Phormidesmis sp. RL_2_1]